MTASSEVEGFYASHLIDGDPRTRWESEHSHKQQRIEVQLSSLSSVHFVLIEWESSYAKKYQIEFHREGVWDIHPEVIIAEPPSRTEEEDGRWWRTHQFYSGVLADRIRIVLLETASWWQSVFGTSYSIYNIKVLTSTSLCSSDDTPPTGSWHRKVTVPAGVTMKYSKQEGIDESQRSERTMSWGIEASANLRAQFTVGALYENEIQVSERFSQEFADIYESQLTKTRIEVTETEVQGPCVLWQWIVAFPDSCGSVDLLTDDIRCTSTASRPPCCLPGYDTSEAADQCADNTPNLCDPTDTLPAQKEDDEYRTLRLSHASRRERFHGKTRASLKSLTESKFSSLAVLLFAVLVAAMLRKRAALVPSLL